MSVPLTSPDSPLPTMFLLTHMTFQTLTPTVPEPNPPMPPADPEPEPEGPPHTPQISSESRI